MKKKRNSSIELLRIIAMLAIIAQHYVFHGGYADEVFNAVTPNIVYLKILKNFGYAANTVFALISGYFLIRSNVKKDHYRRILPLVFEVFFYSVCVLIVVLATRVVPLSLKDILKMLLPVFYGNWYGVYYILLWMFVPFLNPFLLSLNQKDYRRLLLTCFTAFILIQTCLGNVYALTNLDFLIVNYLFGAYYRLYPSDFEYPNRYNLYAALLAGIVIAGSVIGFDLLGVWLHNDKFILYDYFFMTWYMVPAFVLSVASFMFASRIEFSNRIIDTLASTVFGVYLLHDSRLKVLIWEKIFPNVNYVSDPYLHSVLKILAVFLLCAMIDLLRQKTVDRAFRNHLEQRLKKR